MLEFLQQIAFIVHINNRRCTKTDGLLRTEDRYDIQYQVAGFEQFPCDGLCGLLEGVVAGQHLIQPRRIDQFGSDRPQLTRDAHPVACRTGHIRNNHLRLSGQTI